MKPTESHDKSIDMLLRLKTDANAHFLDNRFREALPLYIEALKLAPSDPHLHANIAAAYMQLGEFEQAEQYFDVALKINPINPAALNNYADLLSRRGKKAEALARLIELNNLSPGDPEIMSNIGAALNSLGRQSEALAWFDRALDISADFSDAHYGKAAALTQLGDRKLAWHHCVKAIENKPNAASPRLLSVMMALPAVTSDIDDANSVLPEFSERLEELRNWLSLDEANFEALGEIAGNRQPFALAYRKGNLRDVLMQYGQTLSRAASIYWKRRNFLPLRTPPRRSKIRLAILNEQIRRHSVWDIILKGIVRHIDREQFELFLYHTGRHVDEETEWGRSSVDRFIQGPMGHADWLNQIAHDLPDVIFSRKSGWMP